MPFPKFPLSILQHEGRCSIVDSGLEIIAESVDYEYARQLVRSANLVHTLFEDIANIENGQPAEVKA